MRVERVQARGFVTHDDLDLTLPESGVVVITGSNGAGKSSIIEAVATAVWGKTLRGASPWRAGRAGVASVTANGENVTRSRSEKGRSTVEISGDVSYDTARAAQSVLTARWGDIETWRRTSVFSASDADAFTTAPDAERKRLLERLLGLARFDAAYRAAREDARDAAMQLREAQESLQSLTAKRSAATAAHASKAETLAAIAGSIAEAADWCGKNVTQEQLNAAKTALTEAIEDSLIAERTLKTIEGAIASATRVARAASSALARLERMGECPTCQQPISAGRLAVARKVAEKANTEAATQETSLGADQAAASQDVVSARATANAKEAAVDTLKAASVRWHAERRSIERQAALKEKLEAKLKEDEATLERLAPEIAAQERAVAAARHAAALLNAVVSALSTRGVRAHVTARALSGLETVANHWLARVAGEISISLAVNDAKGRQGALRLDVHGAGGGNGYRGASAGERRRIDVALLFALAETASAAAGRGRGTLWVDEAFDTLDRAGVAAVTRALADVAKDRCVVVITHNEDLAEMLPAKARINIGTKTP